MQQENFSPFARPAKKLIKFARGAALLSDSVSVLNNAARLLLLQNLHLIILTSSAAVRRRLTELSWSGLNLVPFWKQNVLKKILQTTLHSFALMQSASAWVAGL